MEQRSIVNILLGVNENSNLDGTNIVQEIKKAFTSAIKDKKINKTEREAIETAYQNWEEGNFEIDYFFEFNVYLFGDSRASTLKQTFLHFAAKHNYQSVVNALLKAGAKFDVIDGFSSTPLHCAAINGHVNVVNALIQEGATIDVLDRNKSTPLHFAAKNDHVEVVNALIKAEATVDILDGDKNTPLHFAAGNGHIKTVELLLKEGTDINAQNEFGRTPLHLAAKNGHKSVVEFLLHKGAEVDVLSGGIYKNTPLHLAAKNGHIRVVAPLLKNGANINAQNGLGETPLHLATFEGKDEIVQFLIDEKAELFLKNSKGWIPSDCVNREIIKHLKEAEKKAQQPNKYAIILGIAGCGVFGLFIGAMLLNDLPEAAIAFAAVVSVGVVSAICGVILYMCLKPSAEKKPVIVGTNEINGPKSNMDDTNSQGKGTAQEKEGVINNSSAAAEPTM